jgi:site-specific recombinase XerD
VESADHPIAISPASGDWLPPSAAFTPAEIPRLFEADSPLLRRNPYALSAPSNTQRARRSDWKVFATFCAERQYLALPASPAVVAAFIETMSTPTATRPARAVATLERYISTIAHAHALAELPDPTRTAYVRGAYRQFARGRPTSQPKQALRWEHVQHALATLRTDSITWDLRAKALLAVAYSTMARRAELVALAVEDLSMYTTGDGTALIRMTKVGREEPRYLTPEVVTHLRTWLDHVQITSGPVFRRIENSGTVGRRALHPQEVAREFQRIARRLNATASHAEPAWPALRLGAHSTRIGAAHDLAAAGIDLTSIMHSGGWNDPKMPRYYTRELAAKDSGMARMARRRTAAELNAKAPLNSSLPVESQEGDVPPTGGSPDPPQP